MTTLFRRTIFCLAPTGDSLTRKSVFDSLLTGCIPVIFARATMTQYKWYFSDEDINNVAVYIPRQEVIDKGANVIDILKGKSADEIKAKQDAIEKIAPRLQYSVVPEGYGGVGNPGSRGSVWGPPTPDAADIIIEKILDRKTVEPIEGFSDLELEKQKRELAEQHLVRLRVHERAVVEREEQPERLEHRVPVGALDPLGHDHAVAAPRGEPVVGRDLDARGPVRRLHRRRRRELRERPVLADREHEHRLGVDRLRVELAVERDRRARLGQPPGQPVEPPRELPGRRVVELADRRQRAVRVERDVVGQRDHARGRVEHRGHALGRRAVVWNLGRAPEQRPHSKDRGQEHRARRRLSNHPGLTFTCWVRSADPRLHTRCARNARGHADPSISSRIALRTRPF